jgi:hypothetical protein
MRKPVFWLDTIPLFKITQPVAQQPCQFARCSNEMVGAASTKSSRNVMRKCPGNIPATSEQSYRAVLEAGYSGRNHPRSRPFGRSRNERRHVRGIVHVIRGAVSARQHESSNSSRPCPTHLGSLSEERPGRGRGSAHGLDRPGTGMGLARGADSPQPQSFLGPRSCHHRPYLANVPTES